MDNQMARRLRETEPYLDLLERVMGRRLDQDDRMAFILGSAPQGWYDWYEWEREGQKAAFRARFGAEPFWS